MKFRSLLGAIFGTSLLATLLAPSGLAQGSAADYRRSTQVAKMARGAIQNLELHAQWDASGQWVWYEREDTAGRREHVLVSAETGIKSSLPSHEEVLAAVQNKAGAAGAAKGQASTGFDGKSFFLYFEESGTTWRYDLESKTVFEAQLKEATCLFLEAEPELVRSRNGKGPTSIVFINDLEEGFRVLWVEPSGAHREYGVVGPGEALRIGTDAGHSWLLKFQSGEERAAFVANENRQIAWVAESTVRPSARVPQAHKDARLAEVFIRSYNAWIRYVQSGDEVQLTTDGEQGHGYDQRPIWSPDGTRVVITKTRKGDSRKVYYVESSPPGQVQPKLHSYNYLKPGDAIDLTKPHLFDVELGIEIPISDELFPNPWSLRDVTWDVDSKRFTFLYNERGHQVLRIVAVDAESGHAKTIVNETSETFIDYSQKSFRHDLANTGEVIWMSERDGWNHLYLYDSKTGRVKNQITHGDWVVRGVERVDEERREIVFRLAGFYADQDPYLIHYARVQFDGEGMTLLTKGDGTHNLSFSNVGDYYFDSFSRVDLAPVVELRRTKDGALVCELERADWSEAIQAGWQPPERFVAKGRDGKTNIYGIIHRPTNFDPELKYPVIESIYAGPHGAFVPKAFQTHYRERELAELGFIVVQIDGMGTNFRSRAFHDVCWKNIGDSGFPDRILWMEAAGRKDPAMDLTRVGIFGGSAGGQSSTRALLAFGDFYDVAVSDCGCHDNRVDKIWWNEAWMGWPIGPHYEEQSNVTQAHRLKGKLLLTVGEMDENVDPASTLQVVDALIRADKDFDLIVFPGAGHGAGSSAYGVRRRRDFFVRHLLGVEPRWE